MEQPPTKLKIVVIDSNPQKIEKELKKQSRSNLLSTFVPIKIEFPQITVSAFYVRNARAIAKLINELEEIDYLQESSLKSVKDVLSDRYGLHVDEKKYYRL